MEIKTSRQFKHLVFNVESLRNFIEEAGRRFRGGFKYYVKARFSDRSGEFSSLDNLLSVTGLPSAIYDFELWMRPSGSGDSSGKCLWLSTGYPDVDLMLFAEDDDVWVYGVAEVLGRILNEIENNSSPSLRRPGIIQRLRNYLRSIAKLLWTGAATLVFGLVLSAWWFGGLRAVGTVLSIITVVFWVLWAIGLIFISIPSNSAFSLRQTPTLTLVTRTNSDASAENRIADETLAWTKKNVFATVFGIVMGVIGVIGGVLLTVWLTKPNK